MEYNTAVVEESLLLVLFAKILKDYPAVYDYDRNRNRVLSFEMEMLATRMRQFDPNFTLEDCAWCMSQCRGVLVEVTAFTFISFENRKTFDSV